MKTKIKEALVKNYIEKEANHLVENAYDTDFEDIIENGIEPAKDQPMEVLLLYGFECETCGAEVLNAEMKKQKIDSLIEKNKCPKCYNKIFIDV